MAGYIVGRIQTEPLVKGSYNLVQLISMKRGCCLSFFKVGGQSSRSYCYVVGRIQTESKAPGSYNLLQFIDVHDAYCYSGSEVKVIVSLRKA